MSSRAKESKTNKSVYSVSEFKAQAPHIFVQLSKGHGACTVTRRGIPIARVIPLCFEIKKRGGSLRQILEVTGDIVTTDWSADWEVLRK